MTPSSRNCSKALALFAALLANSASGQVISPGPQIAVGQAAGGDLTGTFPSPTIGASAITLAKMANLAANTVIGNNTAGAIAPIAMSIGTCSTSASALIWTTNTGFGCNTAIAASTVTTNANLTGPITSTGNATAIASQTGTGTTFVMNTTPTITGAVDLYPATFQGVGTSGHNNGVLIKGGLGASDNALAIFDSTGGTAFMRVHGDGSVQFPSIAASSAAQTGTLCWAATGITYDTTLGCLSSLEELKDIADGVDSAEALQIVKRLNPIWFSYKQAAPESDHAVHAGLGAHQVESVDKRLVAYGPDGALRGVRYADSITSVNTAAIKGLIEQNQALIARIAKLEQQTRASAFSWWNIFK